MAKPARTLLGATLAAALLVLGCRPVDEQPRGRLDLLDGSHHLDVLTHRRSFARPSEPGGARFLAGWRLWTGGGGRFYLAGDGRGRLEGVHLGGEAPRLLLEPHPDSRGPLEVRVAGHPPAVVDLQGTVEIALPLPLPLGRFPIDLALPGDNGLALKGAALLPRAAAATAERREDGLAQGAGSLVQITVPRAEASRLRGRVRVAAGGDGSSVALLWESEAGDPQPLWQTEADGRERLHDIDVTVTGRGFARVSLLARGEPGFAARWEHLALDAPPPAEGREPRPLLELGGAERPRLVVVYVLDALRADSLGRAGDHAATPVLDRLANEGLVHHAHRSTAPNTLPSTKTLFTGEVWRQGGGWKLPATLPTLAERWRAAGYATGLFSANVYVTERYGMTRGFDFVDQAAVWAPEADSRGVVVNASAEAVHRGFLAWLQALPEGASAFAYLHTLHPHNPYTPPGSRPAADGLDGSTESLLAIRNGRLEIDAAGEERVRRLYAENLAFNDGALGDLLARLAQRYEPGEALLVVTSDHGEELFEHDGVLHGYALYEEQIEIPLLWWAPGRIAPGRIEARTTTQDLHDLLAALADAGHAHLPVPASPAIHFAAASSIRGGIFAARTDRWKAVWAPRTAHHWGMGEGRGRSRDGEYLFDLQRDPGEHHNLAGAGDLEASWLRGELLRWVEAGAALDTAEEAEPEAEEIEKLRALGYVE